MAEVTVAIGAPVLWFGHELEVTAIEERGGKQIATVQQKNRERTDAIRAEILALREQQATLKGDEHATVAAQIQALDAEATGLIVRAKVQADHLKYWPKRGVWVSDGRILTPDQVEKFKELTGSRPSPAGQRAALLFLESNEE